MLAETRHYLDRIVDLRGQVRALIQDLPPEALNWRPMEAVPEHTMNSLAVLAAHVAGAEFFWAGEVIGGAPPTRNRDEEFVVRASQSAPLVAQLDRVGQQTHAILSKLSLDDLGGSRVVQDKEVTVRWALLHIIDHTALHLGHMQITYQLWMQGQSGRSPRWFERLPQD